MKIKELHLRNIASIETADIDFEKGLNDGITGDPASIFLITGDTGAGKSVILDGISMALYKTTPRLTGVKNTNNNEFTNAEGENVRVSCLEQYTRLGISENSPSYSMVVFEGNDGMEYTARLSLGFLRGNTNKEGKRPLKYRSPKWEVKTGNADFTSDSVEQTILNAVGLTFEQFGRMAMLAQGQFAAFLTGDKSERSEILEQLTNTQHFSAYGDAISRLYEKAKIQRNSLQKQLDTSKANPLAQIAPNELAEERNKLVEERQTVSQQTKKNADTLSLVLSILQNEADQAKATQERQRLETQQNSPEFQQTKSLVERWDATHPQRQQLDRLKQASQKKANALQQLNQLRAPFVQLSEDLAYRIQQAQRQDDLLFQQKLWLDERKDRDTLYTQHREYLLKMSDFASKTAKVQQLANLLKETQGKTESLSKALKEANENVLKARQAVQEKQQAIDAQTQRRASLNPDGINSLFTQAQHRKNNLDLLVKSMELLAKRQQDQQQLQQEINRFQQTLNELEARKKAAEEDYQKKKTADDEAKQRLNTLKMSVSDTLVELRKRLQNEHSETCPLCGQPIQQLHLDEEFQHLLTPLEKEQQKTTEALKLSEQQKNQSTSAYHQAEGELTAKQKAFEAGEKQHAQEQKKVLTDALAAGLNTTQPLEEQIPAAKEAVEGEIQRLSAAQKEAEDLQKDINRLLNEKKPLDETQRKAEKALQQAQNDLDNNQRDIENLQKQNDELKTSLLQLDKELTASLANYDTEWKSHLGNTCTQLRQEAERYLANKTKHETDKANLEVLQTNNATLQKNQLKILELQPEWKSEFNAKVFASSNILAEWTNLLSQISALKGSITEGETTIRECQSALDDYYTQSETTQAQLETLLQQAGHIEPARRTINECLAAVKSNADAIARYTAQITQGMTQLGITQREELPEKTALEEAGKALQKQFEDLVSRIAAIEQQLKDYEAFEKQLKDIETQLDQAQKVYDKWEKLNRHFGGKRFRVLVQTYILRPLLNNANIYLEKITDRYTLTCSEDNEQLAILVLDRYNKNQVRSVTVLSGGERFMISLALSLALSSLNRPDMNVNILFIDEGFGTLDEHCLDSVMATLEKLQDIAGQSNRRVGIISHREELEDRIPVKIKVKKQGEGRSTVKIEKKT